MTINLVSIKFTVEVVALERAGLGNANSELLTDSNTKSTVSIDSSP